MSNQISSVNVRNIEFLLHTHNRSLELCARMNYETEVLDFIDSLNDKDILYDLGAAEGRFSLYAAARGIRVIAFEPENNNHAILIENINLNPHLQDKITVFNLAVGESNQQSTIKIGQPWPGGHQKIVSVGPGRIDLNFNFSEEQPITIVTLDHFIESKQLPKPTALKIDIDGSEIPFTKGAQKTLASMNLTKIIFELCTLDDNYLNILDLLQENGFQEQDRFVIPKEPNLFNIIFTKC